ncbi:MAG: hydrogenase maturation nickel metallochaperone HypA [Thermoguttaceae bacterium]
MHELAIVEALIDQVKETLDRTGEQGRVMRVDLSIGRLSGVSCQSLQFAFRLLAPGTAVEGAEIAIEEPKASCSCHACHASVEIDDLVAECPRCGSGDIVIDGGRDLILQSIEVEE